MRLARLFALAVGCAAASIAPQSVRAQLPSVTRRDLAQGYLQIDRIAATRGLPADRRAEWNRAFDRTTLAFFGGDFPRVLRDMHALYGRMSGDSASNGPTRQLLQLRLTTSPRVLVRGRDSEFYFSVEPMYADSLLARTARPLDWRLLDAAGVIRASGQLVIPEGVTNGTATSVRVPAGSIVNGPGRYRLELRLRGASSPLTTDVFVMSETPATVRARLQRSTDALPRGRDPHDVAAVRARAALVTEEPSETNSASFLADPVTLTAAVDAEIRALAAGQRPFSMRTGDYWRVIIGPKGPVPVRIFAPRDVRLGNPMPVVFALHGAGADENMFFEGYGAGRLRALADSMQFILVAPLTMPLLEDVAAFDSTLAVISRDYLVDRNAIFVLGHSLGGMTTMKLAVERRSTLRAAAVIAGAGPVPPNVTMAPTLFVGAEVDLVVPAPRVQATYEQARDAGANVDFSLAEGWGHTLVVGARLDEALRWLFGR